MLLCQAPQRGYRHASSSRASERTGLSFFLISVSRVPALRTDTALLASGSWAMGEPHSGQKTR